MDLSQPSGFMTISAQHPTPGRQGCENQSAEAQHRGLHRGIECSRINETSKLQVTQVSTSHTLDEHTQTGYSRGIECRWKGSGQKVSHDGQTMLYTGHRDMV